MANCLRAVRCTVIGACAVGISSLAAGQQGNLGGADGPVKGPIEERLPIAGKANPGGHVHTDWCVHPVPPRLGGQRGTPGPDTTLAEVEPNDAPGTGQFITIGTDGTIDDAVDVLGAIGAAGDEDEFRFNLVAGDILGVAVLQDASALDPIVQVHDGAGTFLHGNDDGTTFSPPESPMPIIVNSNQESNTAFIAPSAGEYRLRVSGFDGTSTGAYRLQIRVFRQQLEAVNPPTRETIFVDFNGASIDAPSFFGSGNNPAILSPLSSFLGAWGLVAADEDVVIDSILAIFKLRLDEMATLNPNFDYEMLNSRDHPDPFGSPNVSRMIVGGTQAELGIGTIGIAEWIDAGNFSQDDTAVVLLDLLSTTGSGFACQDFARDPGFTLFDAIGRVVGNICAHEAGHYLGSWHTQNDNTVPSIMDQGGGMSFIISIPGLGPDLIMGSADDNLTEFVVDEFETEGIGFGDENTNQRTGTALSTFAGPPCLNYTETFDDGAGSPAANGWLAGAGGPVADIGELGFGDPAMSYVVGGNGGFHLLHPQGGTIPNPEFIGDFVDEGVVAIRFNARHTGVGDTVSLRATFFNTFVGDALPTDTDAAISNVPLVIANTDTTWKLYSMPVGSADMFAFTDEGLTVDDILGAVAQIGLRHDPANVGPGTPSPVTLGTNVEFDDIELVRLPSADWLEEGDAGQNNVGEAQRTEGSGTLGSIQGTFACPEDIDLYCVHVTDEANFRAETFGCTRGSAVLFVFNEDGTAQVASTTDSVNGSGSQGAINSDGIFSNGIYYIAIASVDGALPFPQDAGGVGAYPTGQGTYAGDGTQFIPEPAAGPLAQWTVGAPGLGPYTITLTGASYCDPPDGLYTLDRLPPELHQVDPANGASLGFVPVTAPFPASRGFGMAADPTDGTLYAVLGSSQTDRRLATIHAPSGLATDVGGPLPAAANSIAFDGNGQLWLTTGDGGTPGEELYRVNKSNGATALHMALGNGNDGEAIGFNFGNGLLYHASGRFPLEWESVNPVKKTVTPIFTEPVRDEIGALTYCGNGEFLAWNIDEEFVRIAPDGTQTVLGTEFAFNNARGLAFLPPFPTGLYAVYRRDNVVNRIDPADGSTLTSVPINLPGESIQTSTGLTIDPTTGIAYAVVRTSVPVGFGGGGGGPNLLITLDPVTGDAVSIGDLGDNFSNIQFDENGQLWGVTGNAATVQATLYTIDKTNAATTLFVGLTSDAGHALGFNPDKPGRMYHATGCCSQGNELFEIVDLTTGVQTPIPVTGDFFEMTCMVYNGLNEFLAGNISNDLLSVTTGGAVTTLGNNTTTPDDLKGLALFPAVLGTCDGDANGDGAVDVNDISYVIFRLGGGFGEGDVNCDGSVDVNDISYVIFRLGTCN